MASTQTRSSHGALSLIRPAASDRPAPRPPSTSPGRPLSSHPGACPWPPVAGASSAKPGVDQSHRRPRRVWQVPSWRAIACELSTGLGKVCRGVTVSAAAGESRALEAPCLERDEGDDGHEAKRRRRCAVFLPEHDGGWWVSVHCHHHRGRPG